MKNSIYITFLALLVLVSFTACKKDIASRHHCHPSESAIDGKWSLVRLNGGIAGANENHPAGEIEWTFNSQNGTLTVNNTASSSMSSYLLSGVYNFHEISGSTQNYLVIDSNELGQFIVSGNQMLIDENKKSSGEGACGFYLVLER